MDSFITTTYKGVIFLIHHEEDLCLSKMYKAMKSTVCVGIRNGFDGEECLLRFSLSTRSPRSLTTVLSKTLFRDEGFFFLLLALKAQPP